MQSHLLPALLLAALASPLAAQDHWPQFRGPHGSAAVKDTSLPVTWSARKNVLWQAEIPGRGWSSPVVWGNRVFVTAVLNDKTPPPRRGLYILDLYGKIPPGNHVWKVYCLDLGTGKVVWEKTAHEGTPGGAVHLKNTYASETPVTDGEHVYVYFGNLGLFCYDMKGAPVWSKNLGAYKTRNGWGTGASPVLYQDKLLLVNDNQESSFLVALDKKTGRELWKVERDEKSNWATPLVWENDRRVEIVTCGSKRVRSYGLDGKLLWELGGMSVIVIPTPSADAGLLYLSSGYVLDLSRPLYAVKSGAKGDISLKEKEESNDFVVWCQKKAGPYHPSPVVQDGFVYVLLDKGFLSCYDARTGKEIYVRQRLDPGSDKFTASPWAAGNKIYCLSEDGDTYVVRAGPKFEVLAKNSLGDEMCLASPALARGTLLVRTASKLYRIGEASAKR
jgi:outer membrane protein assembly factor BamB